MRHHLKMKHQVSDATEQDMKESCLMQLTRRRSALVHWYHDSIHVWCCSWCVNVSMNSEPVCAALACSLQGWNTPVVPAQRWLYGGLLDVVGSVFLPSKKHHMIC